MGEVRKKQKKKNEGDGGGETTPLRPTGDLAQSSGVSTSSHKNGGSGTPQKFFEKVEPHSLG